MMPVNANLLSVLLGLSLINIPLKTSADEIAVATEQEQQELWDFLTFLEAADLDEQVWDLAVSEDSPQATQQEVAEHE